MRKHEFNLGLITLLLGAFFLEGCADDALAGPRQRRRFRERAPLMTSEGADAGAADVSDTGVADASDAAVADASDAAVADASDAAVADADTNSHAFSPDGVDDTIIVTDSADFDGVLNKFTICAWIKEADYAVADVIMAKNTSLQREWTFRINSSTQNTLQLCVQSGLTNSACPASCSDTSASLTDGVAAFVCAVYDGTQGTANNRVTLYVNATVNAETCSGTIPTAFNDGTAPVEIGSFGAGASGEFGAGTMDEVTYWNVSLTATDINNLCCGVGGGCGGTCGYGRSNTHGISGLTYYLDFDGDLGTYVNATDEADGDDTSVYTNCASASACISTTVIP